MVFEEDSGTGSFESFDGTSRIFEETPESAIYHAEIEDAPRGAPTVDSAIDPTPRTADLLLVDDNFGKLQGLACLARRILGPKMSVLPTSDPETAIRAVKNGVRAVLTDFNMGAWSGADMVRVAMENGGIPYSHILVATCEPDAARAVIPQEIKIFGLPNETEELKSALTELNLMLRGAIGEA